MDHLFLCHVFLILLRLFIAAFRSSDRKGLTSRFLLVMFIVFLLLSHVVSWARWVVGRFLIFAVFLHFIQVSPQGNNKIKFTNCAETKERLN